MRPRAAIALALAVFALAGAALFLPRAPGPGIGDPGGLRVTASIFPLADIVRQVGGQDVSVGVLLPPGASPHTFEPTPAQVREIASSGLVFLVGAGLDPWAERLLAAGEGPATRVARLAAGLELAGSGCDHGCAHDHHHGHHHGHDPQRAAPEGNPHIWLDPVIVRDHIVPRVAGELASIDPSNATAYRDRALEFQARLTDLDGEIRAEIETWRLRSFIAFHPAWTYFAARYGLREAGIIRETPEREPTPENILRIIRAVEKEGIGTIFAEIQFPPAIAEAIASETGTVTAFLDPLGGDGLPGRGDYPGLIRYNLGVMSRAMR